MIRSRERALVARSQKASLQRHAGRPGRGFHAGSADRSLFLTCGTTTETGGFRSLRQRRGCSGRRPVPVPQIPLTGMPRFLQSRYASRWVLGWGAPCARRHVLVRTGEQSRFQRPLGALVVPGPDRGHLGGSFDRVAARSTYQPDLRVSEGTVGPTARAAIIDAVSRGVRDSSR